MSDYEPTDSESDYDQNEKILLENVRRGKHDSTDESEEEVFNVGVDGDDSDSDEDEIELADSDVEGQEDGDNIPNENAWGKDKRKFYSTDFVDPDYEELDEKTARLAELEEEEASRLQLKLARQLTDDDFGFDFFKQESEKSDDLVEEKIKTDTSKLTKREKLQFLKQESPELFGLMKDYKAKMEIRNNFLEPVLNLYRSGKIDNSSALDFVQTFNTLISNYTVVITAYLLLKSHKTKMENHPIIKRLLQYRQLLEKLCSIFDDIMKSKIQDVLNQEKLNESGKVQEKKRMKHKVAEKVEVTEPVVKKKKTEKKNKVHKNREHSVVDKNVSTESTVPENFEDEMEDPCKESDKMEKRGITYQIEKNKGLTPRRKKEQRNPRVKHRNKFRKAKIRRKGAVREVRNELKRYGGEISGIKSTVTKSIKLKS